MTATVIRHHTERFRQHRDNIPPGGVVIPAAVDEHERVTSAGQLVEQLNPVEPAVWHLVALRLSADVPE
jgi:hypothetical protein